jgi:hypothetical protein
MKSLAAILTVLMMAVGCSHTTTNAQFQPPVQPSQETALQAAKDDLRSMGIDPDTKRLTIISHSRTKDFFAHQPHNDYWDKGRAAVGLSPFYILTFAEPQISPGGVHQYFVHAQTQRCLWVARAK